MRSRLRHMAGALPRLTRRGQVLLAAGIAGLAAGCATDSAALIQLALFCLILPATALGLAYLNLRGLVFRHVLPTMAFRNEPFEIELSVRNEGRILDKFDATVSDQAIGHRQAQSVLFRNLPAATRTSFLQETRFKRRGIHGNFRYALTSSFPLGLTRHEIGGRAPGNIIVCPRPRLPLDAARILESGMGLGGLRQAASADVVGDLKSMREYRTGDHPKRISWPFSARFGTVIVRELEQPAPERVTLYFHSYQPPGVVLSRRSFERALELLSGLFVHLCRNGIPFDLVAPFTDWLPLPVTVDAAALRRAQTVLAQAAMTTSPTLDDLSRALALEGHSTGLVIVLSNAPTRLWAEALPRIPSRIFCLDNRSAGKPAKSPGLRQAFPGAPGPPAPPLERGAIP
jgi:uncharacterized protein (DUF58 family)